MQVIVILYSIVILFYGPVDSRKCYDCFCDYNWETSTGSCLSTEFQSNCPLREFGNQYCMMTNYYSNNYEQRFFQSISPDTFQDSHFFQALEYISLSNTTWLPTVADSISYGCDWEGCNHPSLAGYLPESFQMNVNQTILDFELLNGQLPAENCYFCSQCINSLTATLCRPQPCTTGICYIDEIHNYIVTAENNCTYYFSSTCQTFTDSVQTPRLRIRATYYIDFPTEKQLEINEIDITCTKDYCNSIETVERLKEHIQTTVNIPPGFRPYQPTDASTGTDASTRTDASTGTNASTATSKRSITFLYSVLVLLLL